MKGNLFIITSPSGGGKGTLIKKVLPTIENLSYSVSYTTRNKREGEVHGRDYSFVSIDDFKNLIKNDELLEFAEVHNNFYGTSKNQVERETDSGNDIILEIDVEGAEEVQKKLPNSVGIFILPPSYKVLAKRLIERNTENQENLTIRLNNAREEVKRFAAFDFIIVNDELEKATNELRSIILAERLKCDRQIYRIQDILNTFENY
ncbi:MAG: guanylate kinase [Aridibacter sp.]